MSKPQYRLCISEMQTAGTGRRGDVWHSPFGYNLYLSVLWSFNRPAHMLTGLSIVIALVTVETLTEFGLDHALKVKWPNDLIYNNHKLGGILLETRSQQGGLTSCVMSLGLNGYLPTSVTNMISQHATSYYEASGQALDRNQFTASWINRLFHALEDFIAEGLEPFMETWKRYDIYFQQPLSVDLGNRKISGFGMGISDDGLLKVQPEENDQPIQTFHIHEARIIKQA